MIIGVGNDQFTWMYGMGTGVPRVLEGNLACIPNVVTQIRHAGMDFTQGGLGGCFIDSIAFCRVLSALPTLTILEWSTSLVFRTQVTRSPSGVYSDLFIPGTPRVPDLVSL